MNNVYKTDKAVYTANDFIVWQEKGMIELTPKFQRRPVWQTRARSYFIDTILRGMTVPPIYLRMIQNRNKTKAIREVVDGQQRVRSVLDFIENKYKLAKTLNGPWASKRFDQLPIEQREQILNFGFAAEIFQGISDKEILEVFCRLNMNGIPLNKQELRNGKYFGLFKTSASTVALDYLSFWREHRIFSEMNIARMLEVELTSELFIAVAEGMQDKKKSIDAFYALWEENYPNQARNERRFRETIAAISEAFSGGDLDSSEFRRPPLFYTLFCVTYHHLYGLPGIQRSTPKAGHLDEDGMEGLREAVIDLSDVITQAKDPEEAVELTVKQTQFADACARQTDNIAPRKVRFNALYDQAF